MLTNDVDADEILQVLVNTANKSVELSVSMTVAVSGCLVTGLLIGERRWFTEMEAGLPDMREGITTAFRKAVVDDRNGADIEDDPQYIHLKNARYLTGGGFAPNLRATGFFWRGRLAHVSAWSFGEIGPNQA